MTNYEKIRATCVKANPKLMEMSLGCEILAYGQKFILTGNRNAYADIWSTSTQVIPEGDMDEILGHEPTLEHVLVAIAKKLEVEEMGYTMELKTMDLMQLWDLSKPLKEQSEETLTFLADFL